MVEQLAEYRVSKVKRTLVKRHRLFDTQHAKLFNFTREGKYLKRIEELLKVRVQRFHLRNVSFNANFLRALRNGYRVRTLYIFNKYKFVLCEIARDL